MEADLDGEGKEIMLPCCWCGDNDPDDAGREIICPSWDDPDRNDCAAEVTHNLRGNLPQL